MKTIQGTNGPDSLSGGAASDLIFGRGGDDTMRGGSGRFSEVYGAGGDDLLFAQRGRDEFISGGTGDDTIHMGRHAASAYAGHGDDVVYASRGDAYVLGGAGNDTLIESGPASAYSITIDGRGFTHIIRIDGTGGEVVARGFENIRYAPAPEVLNDPDVNSPTNNGVNRPETDFELVAHSVVDFIGGGVDDVVSSGGTVPGGDAEFSVVTDDGAGSGGAGDLAGSGDSLTGSTATGTSPASSGGSLAGGAGGDSVQGNASVGASVGSAPIGGGTPEPSRNGSVSVPSGTTTDTPQGGGTDSLAGGAVTNSVVGGPASAGAADPATTDGTSPVGSVDPAPTGTETVHGGGNDTPAGHAGNATDAPSQRGGMTVTVPGTGSRPIGDRNGGTSTASTLALTQDYETIPHGGATPTYPAGGNVAAVPLYNTVVSGDEAIGLTLQPYAMQNGEQLTFTGDLSLDGNIYTTTYDTLPSATSTIVEIGSADGVGAFLDAGGSIELDIAGPGGSPAHLHLARAASSPREFDFVDDSNTVAIHDNNFIVDDAGRTLAVGNTLPGSPSGTAGLVPGAHYSYALTAKENGAVVAGLVSSVTVAVA